MADKPYLYVNLFTSNDQFCVCNLDEYFFIPVLKKGKNPKVQMRCALESFLAYHKTHGEREMLENDEFHYYNGAAYQKENLTIRDVFWRINIPHSIDLKVDQLFEIEKKFLIPMKALLEEMGIEYKIYGWR